MKPANKILNIAAILPVIAVPSMILVHGDTGSLVALFDSSYQPEIEVSHRQGLGEPDGLAYFDGNLYVADEGASAIYAWDHSELRTLCDESSGVRSPEDVAIDSTGKIYFSDDEAGGIFLIDESAQCRQLDDTSGTITSSEGITVVSPGVVLVSDGASGRIYRVDVNGALTESDIPFEFIDKADSMVFVDEQTLIIGDDEANVVYEWSQSSGLRRIIDGRADFSPESITYSNGRLYITDSVLGGLYEYTPRDGMNRIATFAGSIFGINGLVFDDRGNLYVASQSADANDGAYVIKLNLKPGS